ncbi:MAG: hypothetical protein E7418_01315 [Ruminococcaceae bacterium]|nr:hypothetical protein [Oscillospiraceae bacterium]
MYRVQRKKSRWFLYSLLFLGAFAVGLGIGFGVIKMQTARQTEIIQSIEQESYPLQEEIIEDVPAAVTTLVPLPTQPPQTEYFVAEQAGDICVFTVEADGEKRFSYKLPIAVKDLRPEDYRMFCEGIFVKSKQELLELTEDFSS